MEKKINNKLFGNFPEIAQGSCPTGFDLVQGECRGFYTRVDILWVGAVTTVTEKCAGILGQPIIIHNEEVVILLS